MALTPATKLDAVNLMLSAVGSQPVSSIGVADSADVQLALFLLERLAVMVQGRGWKFNSERDVSFTPNSVGEVILPSNVYSADVEAINNPPSGSVGVPDIVVRQGKLYDRRNHTFDLGQSVVKVDLIYLFDFDETPGAFRDYIAARASRIFQNRSLGDPQLNQELLRDEGTSLAVLKREETTTGDYNTNAAHSVRRAIRRNSPLNRIRLR